MPRQSITASAMTVGVIQECAELVGPPASVADWIELASRLVAERAGGADANPDPQP